MTPAQEDAVRAELARDRDRARTERDRARDALAKLRTKIRRIIDRGDHSDASLLVERISAVVGHPRKSVPR